MAKPTTSADPDSDICPYELNFFAEKHGLSREMAEVILHSNGPSRARCDYAAAAYLRLLQGFERGESQAACHEYQILDCHPGSR